MKRTTGLLYRWRVISAATVCSVGLLIGVWTQNATANPMRPETGLPYSAEAQALLPPQSANSPGQLQGAVGPLRLGIVGDLFATYRLSSRQDQLFHDFELSRVQLSG